MSASQFAALNEAAVRLASGATMLVSEDRADRTFAILESYDWSLPTTIRRVSYENPWEYVPELLAWAGALRLSAPAITAISGVVSDLVQIPSMNAERWANVRLRNAEADEIELRNAATRAQRALDEERRNGASRSATLRNAPAPRRTAKALRREAERLARPLRDDDFDHVEMVVLGAPSSVRGHQRHEVIRRLASALSVLRHGTAGAEIEVDDDEQEHRDER